MNNLQKDVVMQETIFMIVVNALGFVVIGAFLSGLVGFMIYITSGGNEGRTTLAMTMMKSAGVGILAAFIGYVVLIFYAKYLGIEF